MKNRITEVKFPDGKIVKVNAKTEREAVIQSLIVHFKGHKSHEPKNRT